MGLLDDVSKRKKNTPIVEKLMTFTLEVLTLKYIIGTQDQVLVHVVQIRE